jgi:hypothetical protein
MIHAARTLPILALGLFWLGCSTAPEQVTVPEGYPELGTREPLKPPLAGDKAGMGQLIIFSPVQRSVSPIQRNESEISEINDYPPVTSLRSGYTVYDSAGKRVAHTPNNAPDISPGPTKENLHPGRYFVRLDEPQEGCPAWFWVTIHQGELTRVDEKDLAKPPVAE